MRYNEYVKKVITSYHKNCEGNNLGYEKNLG